MTKKMIVSPVLHGSVTARVAAVVNAASAAFPPFMRMDNPRDVASG